MIDAVRAAVDHARSHAQLGRVRAAGEHENCPELLEEALDPGVECGVAFERRLEKRPRDAHQRCPERECLGGIESAAYATGGYDREPDA